MAAEKLVIFEGEIDKGLQGNSICQFSLLSEDETLITLPIKDAFNIDYTIDPSRRNYEAVVTCVSSNGDILASESKSLSLGGMSQQVIQLGKIVSKETL